MKNPAYGDGVRKKKFAVATIYTIYKMLANTYGIHYQEEENVSVHTTATSEIEAFLEAWGTDKQPMCNRFRMLYQELVSMDGITLNFVARPGVSYSIRPKHQDQKERELFAIVDVIDDDPQERWLSVCFYGDMISDPKELGELIPGGLAGSDGYCFDMYEDDETLTLYLVDRLREACNAARR